MSKWYLNIIGILPINTQRQRPLSVFLKNILVAPITFADIKFEINEQRQDQYEPQQPFQNAYNNKWTGYRMLLTNVCFSLAILMDIGPSIWFFATNITNIADTTAVFYFIGVLVIFLSDYWLLLLHKQALYILLADLQKLVNKSKYVLIYIMIVTRKLHIR